MNAKHETRNAKPETRNPYLCRTKKKSRVLMNLPHLSEQEIIRRDKLKELQQLGIDPYPAALYPVNTTTAYIKEHYKGEENKADFAEVCIAGRVMSEIGRAHV